MKMDGLNLRSRVAFNILQNVSKKSNQNEKQRDYRGLAGIKLLE